uniref:Uncharacterized protein n=1 Tax=Megaselia scalaris TaxID=36166 RepID=T1GQX3_MEGSC
MGQEISSKKEVRKRISTKVVKTCKEYPPRSTSKHGLHLMEPQRTNSTMIRNRNQYQARSEVQTLISTTT